MRTLAIVIGIVLLVIVGTIELVLRGIIFICTATLVALFDSRFMTPLAFSLADQFGKEAMTPSGTTDDSR